MIRTLVELVRLLAWRLAHVPWWLRAAGAAAGITAIAGNTVGWLAPTPTWVWPVRVAIYVFNGVLLVGWSGLGARWMGRGTTK
jgi:hypothetical protein